LFAGWVAPAQDPCPARHSIKDSIDHYLTLARDANVQNDQRRRSYFHRALSHAGKCPQAFADSLVKICVAAIQLEFNLDSISWWINKAEQLVELHGQYLSAALIYQTSYRVAFEKYRHLTTLGHYDEAIEGFHWLAAHFPEQFPDSIERKNHRYTIGLYLGVLHYRKGDYPNALLWHENSTPLLTYRKIDLAVSHFDNLGNTHIALGSPEVAISCFRKSEKVFHEATDEARKSTEYLLYTYRDWANLLIEQNQADSALVVIEKGRQLVLRNPWNYVTLSMAEGKALKAKGDRDSALSIYARGMALADSLYLGKHHLKGELALLTGETLLELGETIAALKNFQKALAYFDESFNAGDFSKNPNPETSLLKYQLLKAFEAKANALMVQSQKDPDNLAWLRLSQQTLNEATNLIQVLRKDYVADESKELLSQQSIRVFEMAIETNRQLYERTGDYIFLEDAFEKMEKSKALSLLESLTDISARQFAGIPDSLLQKEFELKLGIAHYKRQLEDATNEVEKEQARSLAFEQRSELDAFRKMLETSYADYYKLKYKLPSVSIAGLRKKLAQDETFVEYFWGDQKVYFITIDSDTVKLGYLLSGDSIRLEIETFSKLIASQKALSRSGSLKKLSGLGYRLYQCLVEPLEIKNPNVLLAPDAWLNLIPFDALVTDSVPRSDYANFPFLIRQLQIDRVFSASVLVKQLQSNGSAPANQQGLLVISPKSFGERELAGNPDKLARQYGGAAFVREKATKENFFKTVSTYRYILFYTHAQADTTESFIQLFDVDRLYLRDLYAKPVPAKLVILTACEAGAGKIKRGEGIMSLARGFAYGGAQTICLTLWEVRSGVSLALTELFLKKHLGDGMPAGKAIHQAKVEFLDNPPMGDASPFLWAGIVMVGK
jgi:CHAT domain-containing protein